MGGGLTSYAPDGFARVRAIFHPDSGSSLSDTRGFTYDADGHVTGSTLRDGAQVTAAYDALGRLRSSSADGSNFTYDTSGRVLTASVPGSAYTNAYDSRGNLLRQTDASGRRVSYLYDGADRRTRMTWPDGFFVTYEYDPAGRLVAIRENGGTALASFGYTWATNATASRAPMA